MATWKATIESGLRRLRVVYSYDAKRNVESRFETGSTKVTGDKVLRDLFTSIMNSPGFSPFIGSCSGEPENFYCVQNAIAIMGNRLGIEPKTDALPSEILSPLKSTVEELY